MLFSFLHWKFTSTLVFPTVVNGAAINRCCPPVVPPVNDPNITILAPNVVNAEVVGLEPDATNVIAGFVVADVTCVIFQQDGIDVEVNPFESGNATPLHKVVNDVTVEFAL